MKNTFLTRLNNYVTAVFQKIAIIRTRQTLMSLDDRTLADIGFTRQQVLTGNFFNLTEVVDFPTDKLGVEQSLQNDKTDEKEAA